MRRSSERGNVFFTLFGAVAVVGVLGAGIMATMRGPLTSMVEVQRKAKAEAEMSIAAKLILLEASEEADSGDCDADGFIEPLEFNDTSPQPTGGGQLPSTIGSSREDPWGVNYGYCAWDAGPITNDAGCGGASQDRLVGTGDSTETYTVIAVVSAGSDKTFQTTCTGGASPSIGKTSGSDDFWTIYSYQDATVASGGLWSIKSGDPDTAEIGKNLEVTGGATFSEDLDLTASTAQLLLGASSLVLPTQAELATCNGANNLLLRINTTLTPPTVEVCDGGNTSWESATAGASIWQQNGTEIYFDTDNVGIGLTDPSATLDVDGTFGLTGAATIGGNINMSNTYSVVWGSGADITEASGALEIDANGGTGVELDVDADAVTMIADVAITGSTADDTANALTVNDSTASDLFVIQNDGDVGIGVTNPNDALDVAGSVDVTGGYAIDGNTILYSDTTMDGSVMLGKSAGSNVTGTNNTILGASAASILTTGTDNIVIGTDVNVPAAGTSNYLNIGDIVHGDIVNRRVGIGFGDSYDVSGFDDALEVNGDGDFTGSITSGSTVVAGGTVTAGVSSHGDNAFLINDGSTAVIFGPADECASDEKLSWSNTGGWSCIDDIGATGSTGGLTLSEVLGNGNDAGGANAVDFGKVSADEFCRADSTDCVDSADLRDANKLDGEDLDTTLSTDTTANGQLLVWSQTNTQWEVGAATDIGVNDLALDGTIDAVTCTSGEVPISDGAGDWACGDASSLSGPASDIAFPIDIEGETDIMDLATTSATFLRNFASDFSVALGQNAGAAWEDANNPRYNAFFGYNTGTAVTTGDYNSFVGSGAGLATTTGSDNVFIGSDSGASNTTEDGNTFLGISSGQYATASGNTLIGFEAGKAGSGTELTGVDNTFVGHQAGLVNTSGDHNTFIGDSVGMANTTGIYNVAVGADALLNMETASSNVAIGYRALFAGTSGGSNVAIGSNAMAQNDGGYQNVAIGSLAVQSQTTGANNLGLGYRALRWNTTGNSNVAFGTDAGMGASTASDITGNALFGFRAGKGLLTGGNYNTLIGYQAGDSITTGADNIIIGSGVDIDSATNSDYLNIGNALFGEMGNTTSTSDGGASLTVDGDLTVTGTITGTTSGITLPIDVENEADIMVLGTPSTSSFFRHIEADSSMAIGKNAGAALEEANDGRYNIFIGENAGATNTSANNNIGIGYNALEDNNGQYNVALGTQALWKNSSGEDNTVVGIFAGQENTSGTDNVVIGRGTFRYNQTGGLNTIVGSEAGMGVASSSSVASNVMVGYRAGYAILTGGSSNTLLGTQAASALTTGGLNTIIGMQAAPSLTTGARNIIIGKGVDIDSATNSDYLNIGNALYGDMGTSTSTGTGDAVLTLDGDLSLTDLAVSGAFDLSNYGAGSVTGTAAYLLAVEADGDVVEYDLASVIPTNLADADDDTKIQVEESSDEDYIRFDTAGTERMVIDDSGNVGIGTSSPGFMLDITASAVDKAQIKLRSYERAIGDGTYIAGIEFHADDTSSGANKTTAEIRAVGEGGHENSSDMPTGLAFYTTPDGTGTPAEVLRLSNSGNIGIGTTSPGAMLDVDGTVRFQDMGVGSVSGTAAYLLAVEADGDVVEYNFGSVADNISADSLDFTEFADAMALDASTSITADGTEVLSIVNTGTGNSFLVEDESSDSTPFVIDEEGSVGIGTSNPIMGEVGLGIYSNSYPQVRLRSSGTGTSVTDGFVLGLVSSGDVQFKNYESTKDIIFSVNSTTEVMRMRYTGNVGIGTSSPGATLDVDGTVRFQDMGAGSVSGTAAYLLAVEADGDVVEYDLLSVTPTNLADADDDTKIQVEENADEDYIRFDTAGTERMVIDTDGNVGIGTAAPNSTAHVLNDTATDVGLIVQGEASQSANLTEWQNNSGTILTEIESDGDITQNQVNGSITAGNTGGLNLRAGGLKVYGNSSAPAIDYRAGFANYYEGHRFTVSSSTVFGGGNSSVIKAEATFDPSSGTNEHSHVWVTPTINQTGTATGITRGVFVEPTLTAADDFRAIEIANNSDYGIYQSGSSAQNYFAGNVGIGRANPDFPLDVYGDSYPQLNLELTSSDTSEYAGLRLRNQANSQAQILFSQDTYVASNNAKPGQVRMATNGAGGVLLNAASATGTIDFVTQQFATSASSDLAMRIDENSNVIIGGTAVSDGSGSGGQALLLDVQGAAGATYYCDEDGLNCFQSSDVGGAASSVALDDITAADATNSIDNTTYGQTWNWALTGAGSGMAFGESTAATGGSDDQYVVSSSTLATSTAMPLYLQNLGAGASFRVDDEAGDTTPFLINESGRVGIGTTSPDRIFEVLADGAPQLRLTDTDSSAYADFQTTSSGELMITPSNENVGINVNPDYAFHVYESTQANVMKVESGGTTAQILFENSGQTSTNALGVGAQNDNIVITSQSGDIVFKAAADDTNTERVRILGSNGAMGIGTSSPGATLDVDGTVRFQDMGAGSVTGSAAYLLAVEADGDVIEYNLSSVTPTNLADADDDTKIQVEESADEDYIRFDTAGTERMVIDDSGNVGIGTDSPAFTLDVTASGSFRASGIIMDDLYQIRQQSSAAMMQILGGTTDTGADPQINLYARNNVLGPGIEIIAGNNNSDVAPQDLEITGSGAYTSATTNQDGGDVVINGGANASGGGSYGNIVLANSGGNVGIGTTSPGATLDVDGTVRFQDMGAGSVTGTAAYLLAVEADGDVIEYNLSSVTPTNLVDADSDTKIQVEESADEDYIRFDTAGTERMVIDDSGNVGIGTGSPAAYLDVEGGPGTLVRIARDATNYVTNTVTSAEYALNLTGVDYAIKKSATYLLYADLSSESIGIGTTGPDRKVDILDTSNPQLRLTYTDSSVYTDFQTDSSGYLSIDTTGDKIALSDYGAGSVTGTAAYLLAVEADGDVVEYNFGSVADNISADSLDFTEFADAMALDASTSITADGTEVLSIVNTGTGNSFLVEDESSDSTPFVIDASGKVGIGNSSPVTMLDVAGSITISGTVDGVDLSTDVPRIDTNSGTTMQLGLDSDSVSGVIIGRTNGSNDPAGASQHGALINLSQNDSSAVAQLWIGMFGDQGEVYTRNKNGGTWQSWIRLLNENDAASAVALDDITAADATNSIDNTTYGQTWNWALTGAGSGMAFGESTAATGGSDDQYVVSASTLATSTAMPLYLQNLGAGDSFRVDDEAADTSPFVIDADGNVGIGTDSPVAALHISESPNARIRMQGTNNPGVEFYTSGGVAAGGIFYDMNNDDISFYAGGLGSGSEHMAITTSGDIGISTSSPSSIFDIEDDGGTAKANQDILEITNAANAVDMDGTEGSILFNQYYYDATTPAAAAAARITMGTEQDWTSTAGDQDSYLAFHTAANGTVSEAMRITSSGVLSIGVTSPGSSISLRTASNIATDGGFWAKGNAGNATGSWPVRIGEVGDGVQISSYKNILLRNENSGGVVIGTDASISDGSGSGGQVLKLDVDGAIGGTYYCDEDGLNCFQSSDVGGAASSVALDDITAADATNSIDNTTYGQTWNWALTGAGSGMAFGESTAATGGSDDQYVVSASTLATSTAMPLYLQNLGAGASFRVDDEATDTTPFVIDTDGNVGIGTTEPDEVLHVVGNIKVGTRQELYTSGNSTRKPYRLYTNGSDQGILDLERDGVVSVRLDSSGLLDSFILYPDFGIGTTTPSATLDVQDTGTAKANADILEITNAVNAADMDGTEGSILFNQYYYDATTPAVADAARITAGTETDWTSTAGDQDSYLAFHTALDGTVSEAMRVTSDKELIVDGPIILDAGTNPNIRDAVKLDRSGDNGIISVYRGGSAMFHFSAQSGDAYIVPVGGGGLGVGTNTPGAKLDVDGTVRFQDMGAGSVTGTAAYLLAVEADGDVVEYNLGSMSSALDDITAADATNSIDNTTYGQTWNWALTGAGSGMAFGESTAATGGSDDQYVVSASTLATSTAMPLYLQNLGAGTSFRVDDEATDTTPFVIDTDGNVGIGTSSPATSLHVSLSSAGSVATSGNAVAVLERGSTNLLQFKTPNTDSGGIIFGDPEDNNSGRLIYSNADDALSLFTDNSERFIINSAGSLTVSSYGAGSVTGTAAYLLAVEADGDVVEYDLSSIADNISLGIDDLTDAMNDTSINNFVLGHDGGSIATPDAWNVAVGGTALLSLDGSDADNNVAIGYDALKENISGDDNTAVGFRALQNTTSGRNTAVGYWALRNQTTGLDNVAMGYKALEQSETGRYNTVVGFEAAKGATGNSNIWRNSVFGYQAGYALETTGTDNTLIGNKAGDSVSTGSDNIIIGSNVDIDVATNDDYLNIGNAILGEMGDTSSGSDGGADLTVDGDLSLTDLAVSGALDLSNYGSGSVPGTAAYLLAVEADGDVVEYNLGSMSSALDDITAADANNTIDNGANQQTWRWALTGASNAGIQFYESSASTGGSGSQAIVRIGSRDTSTAIPLYVLSRSTVPAFRVDDESSDTTPFVIDEDGNVGVGVETPTAKVDIADAALAGSGSLAGSALNIEQTWNTTGAPTAIKLDVTDTASAGSSLLLDLQANSSSMFRVNKSGTLNMSGNIGGVGTITSTGQITSGSNLALSGGGTLSFQSRGRMYSPADGILQLTNAAASDFSRLQFGGTTSSFPSIKRNGTGLDIRLADDSAYADLTVENLTVNGTCTGCGGGVSALNDLSDVLYQTSGDLNLFLGHTGGSVGGNDNNNVSLGYQALDGLNNSGGNLNVAVGINALSANTEGDYNVAIGADALDSNTTGFGNVAQGYDALQANTTGDTNVAIGYRSLFVADSTGNTAIGYESMNQTTSGGRNVAIGRAALRQNTTGMRNIAMGYQAGQNTEGDNNTMLGYQAGDSITTGSGNIIVGYNVDIDVATNSDYLNIGNSLYGDMGTTTSTGSGDAALTIDGDLSLVDLTASGTVDLASYGSGTNTGTATYNLAVDASGNVIEVSTGGGASDLDDLTDALNDTSNVFLGHDGGSIGATDQNNMVLGLSALASLNNSGATDNIGVGYRALSSNTSGDNNVAVGSAAGLSVSSGGSNVLIGMLAGDNITTGSRNIIIGYDIDSVSAGGNDYLAIGNSTSGNAIQGTIGTGDLSAQGTGWSYHSDIRLKEDIRDIETSREKLRTLRGIIFKWNDKAPNKSRKDNYGIIAQDVQKVFPELVKSTRHKDGSEYLEVNYTGLTPVLIEVAKDLDAENQMIQKDMDNMRVAMASLTRQVEDLQRRSVGYDMAVVSGTQSTPFTQREMILIMILGFALMSTMLMLAFTLGRRSR